MSLPEVMPFERVKDSKTMDCYWERIGHRRPRRGEYYVSGAIPMAYRAPNDLSTEFLVVRPTYLAKQVTRWERGDAINFTRIRA